MAALRIVITVTSKLTKEINKNRILDVAGWLNHAQMQIRQFERGIHLFRPLGHCVRNYFPSK